MAGGGQPHERMFSMSSPKGSIPPTALVPLSRTLYVDPNTAVPVADQNGCILRPFDDIQAALDASTTFPVLIIIQFGDYSAQTLTIGAGRDVVIEGPERREGVVCAIGPINWTVTGNLTSRLTVRRLRVNGTIAVIDGAPPATDAWFRAEDCELGAAAGNAITVAGASVVSCLIAGQSYVTTTIVPAVITSRVLRPIALGAGILYASSTQFASGSNAIAAAQLYAESCSFDEATAFTISAGFTQCIDCLFPGGASTITFAGVAGEASFDVQSLYNWRSTGNSLVNGEYVSGAVSAGGMIAEPAAGLGLPRFNSSSIYFAFVLGSYSDGQFDGAGNGGLYSGARRSAVAGTPPVNAPSVALCPYDFGAPASGTPDTGRVVYLGGGGWGAPDAHSVQLYAAPGPYGEATDTGVLSFATLHLGGTVGAFADVLQGFMFSSSLTVSIAASQNNWSPAGLAGAVRIRVTPTVALLSITGLVGVADGRVIVIQNMSTANTLTLSHEDALSAAANRFTCPGGVSVVIPLSGNAVLVYDGTSARWRVLYTS